MSGHKASSQAVQCSVSPVEILHPVSWVTVPAPGVGSGESGLTLQGPLEHLTVPSARTHYWAVALLRPQGTGLLDPPLPLETRPVSSLIVCRPRSPQARVPRSLPRPLVHHDTCDKSDTPLLRRRPTPPELCVSVTSFWFPWGGLCGCVVLGALYPRPPRCSGAGHASGGGGPGPAGRTAHRTSTKLI